MFISVVLPAPFSPRSARISPSFSFQRHGVIGGQRAEALGDPVEMENGHAGIPAMA
jgi:hypothetical protein